MSGTKLKALAVPVPPAGEIEVALRIVEDGLAAVRSLLERTAKTASAIVWTGAGLALAKAFRGELVPQDPTDEPASVLLDRIRVAQVADEPKMVDRGRSVRKSTRPRRANRNATRTSVTEE